MLRWLTPNLFLNSIVDLERRVLEEAGIDGLLLDLDFTLKDQYASEFSPEVVDWVRLMRAGGISLCVVSNGRKSRVNSFASKLGLECVGSACKPLTFGVKRALRKCRMGANRAAIVGDQLFADILAGKLAGIRTILVRPSGATEPWITKIKRPVEWPILRRMGDPPWGALKGE